MVKKAFCGVPMLRAGMMRAILRMTLAHHLWKTNSSGFFPRGVNVTIWISNKVLLFPGETGLLPGEASPYSSGFRL